MLAVGMQKLKDSLSCCTQNGAQHTQILIKENDVSALLKKVTLMAPNGDWLSFDPDEGRKCRRIHKSSNIVVMSPLLTINGHDHHRACDCVVLVNREGKLSVVYIDLKSGNLGGYAGQFKSTRQFVRYALNLLKEFHGEDLEIEQERYVILYGGKSALLNKMTTVSKINKIGKTKPDAAYKREITNSARLYLKELLS